MNCNGDRTGAAERARWLAELAQAVDQAQQLAWSLSVSQANSAEVEGLYRRLEAVRIEIESLRRGNWQTGPADPDPLWTNFLGWNGRPD